MNIHIPERLPNESFDDYRMRRVRSKWANDQLTLSKIVQSRKTPSARQLLRDRQRQNGHGPKGIYGIGLVQPARKRAQEALAVRFVTGFTLVGRNPRRVWRAGISAQRGN